MSGQKDLALLLRTMKPQLNVGEYVFCIIDSIAQVDFEDVFLTFKEQEGLTIVVKKETADGLGLPYSYIASWITLTVHSSLEAVGLTAAFSNALAAEGISCNVVAAYHHDHIFVDRKDSSQAMEVLNRFSR